MTTVKRSKLPMRLLLLGSLLGLGWIAYAWVIPSRQNRLDGVLTASVERTNLTVTIDANGTVDPERSVNISPKNAGILKQLLVKEGDRVVQGRILAQMENGELTAKLQQVKGQLAGSQANLLKVMSGNRPEDIAQTQAQLNQAEASLQALLNGSRPQEIAQAQARLQNAQITLTQAESTLQRNLDLQLQGAISAQALDTYRSARDTAIAQMLEKQQALDLLRSGSRPEDIAQAQQVVNQRRASLALMKRGSRPEDIAQAQAQVEADLGSLAQVQSQLNDTQIRAPFAGIVTRKYANPGSFVAPTTSGSSVSSASSSSILALASQAQVVAKIAEADIARIRIGQTAIIHPDAYPEERFQGQVVQIAPQAQQEQNVTSFEVRLNIVNDPQQRLRFGMNVNVEFQVEQLQQALVIPTASIVQQAEGAGVYILTPQNQPQFVRIQLGATVNDKTEVRSGLTGSEQVLLSFPAGTRPSSNLPPLPFNPKK